MFINDDIHLFEMHSYFCYAAFHHYLNYRYNRVGASDLTRMYCMT